MGSDFMNGVRVGVVGVGHLGVHHARVYTEILGADLVGLVDVDEARVQSILPFFKQFGLILNAPERN